MFGPGFSRITHQFPCDMESRRKDVHIFRLHHVAQKTALEVTAVGTHDSASCGLEEFISFVKDDIGKYKLGRAC